MVSMARCYPSIRAVFAHVAVLALMVLAADGQTVVPVGPPADPFLDPSHDFYNPLRYIASNTLTATAFVLVMVIALIQTFYTFRYGARWMFLMVLGGYTYAAGFGCRFGLHYHPDSEGIYIAEYLFIVLSPCAFIAANYILFGRLARHICCADHVLLPVRKLTLIFVSSDVTTFLIQAGGGGVSVSRNLARLQRGSRIFLVGLVLQLVSFTLFTGIYTRFLYRVYVLERVTWERDTIEPWYRDWRALAAALVISCVGILVRSGYRVAELSQGFQGYLGTTEVFFYGLDAFPLIVATSVYVMFWPGWFINDGTGVVHDGPKPPESPKADQVELEAKVLDLYL